MVHLVQSSRKILQDLAPLDRQGWLAGQSAELRAWFAENGRWRQYAAGEILYLHGDAPDAMYGLGSGALEIHFAPVGAEPVTLHRAEPGFWIGESALLSGEERIISLSAAVEGRVFRVPAAAIRNLVEARPEHWRAFYELSHANTRTALVLLSEALSLTPRARLARLLLRLSQSQAEIRVYVVQHVNIAAAEP